MISHVPELTVMNERSVFLAALEIGEPAARAAYLDQACHCDPALRRGVEELLAAHGRSGSFMGRPAAGEATADYQPIAERPGTVLGPYKLMEQIGEGGMGLVFVAEQQHPVRRKVALKIIRPGMDTQQVIARFEAERQALALMDHQNIAKVFDAGTTESGRPYFVMELVHGIPITDYCDANRLTPRERLELFLPVCHAIQHAHQKGIIHRDIKPSNILVTMYDDKPVPKVIDFGVAKAIEQRLTERTVYTQFGTLVGTFEYMSPEQAEMNAFGVDTRSDVFALGVLLYELLTGTTPLQRHRLREAAYAEIVRLIKEEEPPPPSTRLGSSGAALTGISQQRGSAPGQLRDLVRGELDWIVMRCLEKDRTRRYETANGLARDVERYLHDEPVEACPPTTGYKLRKFARKHKGGLVAAVGFAALLLLGTVVSGWQAVRATRAEAVALVHQHQANENAAQAREKEKEANQQRDEAQKQRDEVRALNDRLQRMLYAADINLAQRAWEEADFPRVVQLLEKHRPKPGEPDLRSFEWPCLHRLCHEGVLLTMKGACARVDYTPDGKCLVGIPVPPGFIAPGYDPVLKVFNATGYNPLLKVWDAQTGQELRSFSLKGASRNVVLSADGKRGASRSDSGSTVKVWDARNGREFLSLKSNDGPITIFSPDGKRLASGSDGWVKGKQLPAEMRVWDAQTGQELLSLKGGNGSAAFSPDGKRLLSGSTVWDAHTGQELLHLNTGPIDNLAFSPDTKRLATVRWGTKDELTVWDTEIGQQLFSIQGQKNTSYQLVAFSPDSKRLVIPNTSLNSPSMLVLDAETGEVLFVLQGHAFRIETVAFSPDGKHLASAGHDMTLRVWDLETGEEIRTLKGGIVTLNGAAGSLTFSPDGKCLVGSGLGGVTVWDALIRKLSRSLEPAQHLVALVLPLQCSVRTSVIWPALLRDAMR
jgi:serine/threonine protein kinase/WD40 repeat protein